MDKITGRYIQKQKQKKLLTDMYWGQCTLLSFPSSFFNLFFYVIVFKALSADDSAYIEGIYSDIFCCII